MRLATLGLVLLLVLSGCHQPPPGWELHGSGQTVEMDGEYRFEGEIEFGGIVSNDTRVTGIRVEFLDANKSLLKTVEVGTFSNTTRVRAEINETFDEPPAFVLIKAEKVETPDRYTWGISGLERTETGGYETYTEYDPIIGTPTPAS